ncbi:MAG: 2-phospho-L-lactate guanylyltransferase [Pseudonocardiales bacterium]|nr:MAG: 2-phospho-L-lactate guanylyltransferase [Pseudonocardiales bacterium]
MRWTVLIPAKSLPEAKSRLLGATGDPAAHARLVLAIRTDTIAAARAAAGVARVVVVTDRAAASESDAIFVQSRPGLNAALREGAAHAASRWPDDGVAALVGDLPALRPDELSTALALAAGHPRAYVADAQGAGTTMLTAGCGAPLRPAFGAGSAARHAVWAVALPAGAGLRADVDTAADLQAALALGVGPATSAALGEPGGIPDVHLDSA